MRFKTILRHMQANHAKEIQPRKRAVAKALAKAKIKRLCPPKVLLVDKNAQNWLKQHLTHRPNKLLYLY